MVVGVRVRSWRGNFVESHTDALGARHAFHPTVTGPENPKEATFRMSPCHDVVEFLSVTRRVCRKSGIRCIASSRFNRVNTGRNIRHWHRAILGELSIQWKIPVWLPEFPATNGTTFAWISGKEDNLARFLTGNLCDFLPAISGSFGWMVFFLKI